MPVSPDTERHLPQGPESANCPVCEGEFVPHPRQIYCSPRCKVLARRTIPAEPQAHSCPACGAEFTANPRLWQIYCPPACRREAESSGTVRAANNAPADSARHHRQRCRNSRRRPDPHPAADHVQLSRNAICWSRPPPGTARTASSQSPSSPCWPPPKLPVPLCPQARTSSHCGGPLERVRLTVIDRQGPAASGP